MEARELLARALEAANGNQAELARRVHRSETTVSRWATGRNGIDFDSALRLGQLTGVPARQAVEACGFDPSLIPVLPTADPQVDPDLAAVSAAWPQLDDGLRRAIRILAGAPKVGRDNADAGDHTLHRRVWPRRPSRSVAAMVAEHGLQPAFG